MINFRRLDLNLLVILGSMFRERSVTAVAAQLGVSQPTVSQSLGKLREFFGDELFVRGREGMLPTAFAATLREPVNEILTTLEKSVFPPVRFDPLTSRRVFTICTSDTGELCFLPSLMRAFEERGPEISLRTVTLNPADLREAFGAGRVDIALGNFPDLDHKVMGTDELTTDNLVCIARKNHPAAREPFTLEAFARCEHAIVAARSRVQRLYEATLERQGLELRVKLRPEHFLSLSFILEASDLIATVPLSVARAFARGGAIEIFTPPINIEPIKVAQHWHRRREADPEIQWLRNLIHELFAGQCLADLTG